MPGLGGKRARVVLLGLGAVETALAGWVISGAKPRLAAATGTALVAIAWFAAEADRAYRRG